MKVYSKKRESSISPVDAAPLLQLQRNSGEASVANQPWRIGRGKSAAYSIDILTDMISQGKNLRRKESKYE